MFNATGNWTVRPSHLETKIYSQGEILPHWSKLELYHWLQWDQHFTLRDWFYSQLYWYESAVTPQHSVKFHQCNNSEIRIKSLLSHTFLNNQHRLSFWLSCVPSIIPLCRVDLVGKVLWKEFQWQNKMQFWRKIFFCFLISSNHFVKKHLKQSDYSKYGLTKQSNGTG